MSERMTEIFIPGGSSVGIAEWGVIPISEMIAKFRRHAAYLREQAEAIESTPDDAFRVRTYVGPYAMRDMKILQEGRPIPRTQGQTP